MRRFGEFVHSLSGKYITAEDMGMETRDMDVVKEVTPYVTGISESKGGAGNPSPITAYGVLMGMKAAAKFQFGTDNLAGKKVLVQGVGHVGETLVKHITDEGAKVIINDINEARLEELSKKYGANVVLGNDIYGLDVDIYAPCALGATINDDTINQIQAKVIAGAANNQLADEIKHGRLLRERGIAYAPDFLINAGGIINVYAELEGYGKDEIIRKTENIYNTTLDIFNLSQKEDITTHRAAFNIAQNRIDTRKKEQNK
jgi:leucine dehydrogenase